MMTYRIKQLIWLYFWLLIFEGAIRKWMLPGLSAAFLIVRDPVVILIYFVAIYQGRFRVNGLVIATIVLGFISFAVSLAVLSAPSSRLVGMISLYGLRANFLHLPLIFLLPQILDADDVKKIGKWMMYLSLPMAVLVFLQYRSPGTSWINYGSTGEGSVQIEAAVEGIEKIRAAGTFSYNTGLGQYLSVLSAFLMTAFLVRGIGKAWLVRVAAFACMLMVGFSLSRTTFSSIAVVFAAAVLVSLMRPQLIVGSVSLIVGVGILFVAASSWSLYSESLGILQTRFEGTGIKVGIVDRYLASFIEPVRVAATTPFFGYGLGLGTNGGAAFLGLRGTMSLGEGELERVIRESGALLGGAYLFLRLLIIVYIGRVAFLAISRGLILPILLFSACALLLLQGQFGQVTTLGFAVFTAGLALAAANDERTTEVTETAAPIPTGMIRGRSAYAEALHAHREAQ